MRPPDPRGVVVVTIAILAGVIGQAIGIPPKPPTPSESWEATWQHAVRQAGPALQACERIAITHGVYGEAGVRVDAQPLRWTTTSSRSLGKHAGAIEACVRGALERHAGELVPLAGLKYEPLKPLTYTLRAGTPVALLPPASALLPAWKRFRAGEANARAELARIVPPDYALTKGGCLTSTWSAVTLVEPLWLPSVGSRVPALWHPLFQRVFGYGVHEAAWDPAGALVVRSERGLCLEPIDAARQRALRLALDTIGTCWTGSFEDLLLRPRVEFPVGPYTSVGTFAGRTCATTAAGGVACCGATDPPLPSAPPGALSSIALGHDFACGLDPGGAIRCWGNIAAPPAGVFTRLSAASSHACGVRATGEIVCWGSRFDLNAVPAGTFVDVAAGSSTCGVRKNGSVECYGDGPLATRPPGAFTRLAVSTTWACGIRTDRSVGCWGNGASVTTPIPSALTEIALTNTHQLCGRRTDETVACSQQASSFPVQPPTAKLRAIAGGGEQFCGVRHDGGIECWGAPWPTALANTTWPDPADLGLTVPLPAPLALAGRVVDEWRRPLAGAEVLVCDDPCRTTERDAMTSRGTLAALLARSAQHPPRGRVVLATTDRDGRWSAVLPPSRDLTQIECRSSPRVPGARPSAGLHPPARSRSGSPETWRFGPRAWSTSSPCAAARGAPARSSSRGSPTGRSTARTSSDWRRARTPWSCMRTTASPASIPARRSSTCRSRLAPSA